MLSFLRDATLGALLLSALHHPLQPGLRRPGLPAFAPSMTTATHPPHPRAPPFAFWQVLMTLSYKDYVCGSRYAIYVYASNLVGESLPYEYGPVNDFAMPACYRQGWNNRGRGWAPWGTTLLWPAVLPAGCSEAC